MTLAKSERGQIPSPHWPHKFRRACELQMNMGTITFLNMQCDHSISISIIVITQKNLISVRIVQVRFLKSGYET